MSAERERRRHARRYLQTIVAYQLGDKRLLTLTTNVGLGGMGIKAHSRLLRGECMRFRLVLGEGLLRVYGTVVYSREGVDGCCISGIQFEELSGQEQVLLQKWLRSLDGLTGGEGFPVPGGK
jgi:hypothetical protein